MKTTTLLTALGLALASSAAIAQTAPAPAAPTPSAPAQPAEAPRTERSEGFDRADYDALVDARVAAVVAGLKLTEEQRRLWQPVEQAYRVMATERAERWEQRRERRENRAERREGRAERSPDAYVERLERRATRVTERAERLTAFSNAMQPFWASLDERQKRLFPTLIRPSFRLADARDGERRGMRHHGMGHHGMERGGHR